VDRNRTLALLRERIVAFAASRLQRDAAEDLAQEVLVVLEQKYQQVEALEELVPLALRILRFKMLGHHRKSARRGEYRQVSVEDLPLADPEPDPETLAERRQARERLREAMLKLEGRCREIFRLKLEGKTFPEIQGILGASSLNTVYTWDFRCRRQLLKLMGGRWENRR
jgi:RNA polymerase sigma-70 factor (ECF subfamily)